jgi:5-methylcytosine-specific restriction endonuclease McrA
MKEHCTNCNEELPRKGKRKKRYCQAAECQKVYRKDRYRHVVPTNDFKWCSHCQTVKPGTEFTIDRRTSDGRRSHCKGCTYLHLFLYGRGKRRGKIERSVRTEIGYLRYRDILKRDEYNCQLCGDPVTAVYDPMNPLTEAEWNEDTACNIDHIIPRCTEGPSTDENLQVTHRRCNREKGRTPGPIQRPPTTQRQQIKVEHTAAKLGADSNSGYTV